MTASVRRPKGGGAEPARPPLNPPLLTSEHVSGAERERDSGKSGERSGEREAAERRAGVTKIGLSGEREIGGSRSAHILCLLAGFLQRVSCIKL